MTTVESVVPVNDAFRYAREVLSGKRAALVAFDQRSAAELSRIIEEADAFTRPLSSDISPSADVLKPFELILVSVEQVSETDWMRGEELTPVLDRCLGIGSPSALLALMAEPRFAYQEICCWPSTAEELLLRCVFTLRSGSRATARAVPAGSTIVLADDDPSITALVRLTLQRYGMTCEIASNGGEALELIKRIKPCAAVLDVGMPGMDGFEILSRMRSVPEMAQTRVILLTGCEQENDILRGFSLGADDYVIKPFNPMELMMRVKRVIGRI
ncbi:MAG: response regulator [Acidobacteriaceae bacterium]|nr:response regulator [Acidobacteriaceae bacterium]